MTSENEKELPPEAIGIVKNKNVPKNTSLRVENYFNAIEQLCEAKGVHPYNAATFLKVHSLRNAVGGSFSRAQEMYKGYLDYLDSVPEEARDIPLPEGIQTAITDLMSFLTWYFRLSYSEIQNDEVKRLTATNTSLLSDIGTQREHLDEAQSQNLRLTDQNLVLTAELQELTIRLQQEQELLHQTQEALAGKTSELVSAVNESSLLNQKNDTLSLQLSERKDEIAAHLEYQKRLNDEARTQQTEISDLRNQREKLTLTLSDLKQEVDAKTRSLTEAKDQVNAFERRNTELEGELSRLAVHSEQLQIEKAEQGKQLTRLTEDAQGINKEMTALRQQLQQLSEEGLNLRASLTAEKTIADSLRITVDTLTSAMTGKVTSQRKPRTTKKST